MRVFCCCSNLLQFSKAPNQFCVFSFHYLLTSFWCGFNINSLWWVNHLLFPISCVSHFLLENYANNKTWTNFDNHVNSKHSDSINRCSACKHLHFQWVSDSIGFDVNEKQNIMIVNEIYWSQLKIWGKCAYFHFHFWFVCIYFWVCQSFEVNICSGHNSIFQHIWMVKWMVWK